MSLQAEPFADPATSREEIFRATYVAHIEHGFTDLSIQQIADEATLSKSTIYHHFDGKQHLLMEYARELLEWYIDEILLDPAGDPVTRLEWSLDLVFLGETANGITLDDIRPEGLDCVYLGLRTQAARNPEIKEYFDNVDRMARERLATLIEQGIEEGSLRDVNPDHVAATLYVILEGGLYLRSTGSDTEWLGHAREMLDAYLDTLKTDD